MRGAGELASFPVPLLFVWPEDDRFLPPAAGKPSVDKIPTARFVTAALEGGLFAAGVVTAMRLARRSLAAGLGK